jgi:hypothetical protein
LAKWLKLKCRLDKCLQVEMSVHQMSVNQVTVYKVSVSQMSMGKLSVNQMFVSKQKHQQNVSKPNDYQPKGVDPFKTVPLQMQNTKSDSFYTKEKFECNTCDLLQNNSN